LEIFLTFEMHTDLPAAVLNMSAWDFSLNNKHFTLTAHVKYKEEHYFYSFKRIQEGPISNRLWFKRLNEKNAEKHIWQPKTVVRERPDGDNQLPGIYIQIQSWLMRECTWLKQTPVFIDWYGNTNSKFRRAFPEPRKPITQVHITVNEQPDLHHRHINSY